MSSNAVNDPKDFRDWLEDAYPEGGPCNHGRWSDDEVQEAFEAGYRLGYHVAEDTPSGSIW